MCRTSRNQVVLKSLSSRVEVALEERSAHMASWFNFSNRNSSTVRVLFPGATSSLCSCCSHSLSLCRYAIMCWVHCPKQPPWCSASTWSCNLSYRDSSYEQTQFCYLSRLVTSAIQLPTYLIWIKRAGKLNSKPYHLMTWTNTIEQ